MGAEMTRFFCPPASMPRSKAPLVSVLMASLRRRMGLESQLVDSPPRDKIGLRREECSGMMFPSSLSRFSWKDNCGVVAAFVPSLGFF